MNNSLTEHKNNGKKQNIQENPNEDSTKFDGN